MCVLLVCDGELSPAIRPDGIEKSRRHKGDDGSIAEERAKRQDTRR